MSYWGNPKIPRSAQVSHFLRWLSQLPTCHSIWESGSLWNGHWKELLCPSALPSRPARHSSAEAQRRCRSTVCPLLAQNPEHALWKGPSVPSVPSGYGYGPQVHQQFVPHLVPDLQRQKLDLSSLVSSYFL